MELFNVCPNFPGPPFQPDDFHVTLVKPHSIIVNWIAGYNGGFKQVFVIKYTDVGTDHSLETPNIQDTDDDNPHEMEYNISNGILQGKRYKLELIAFNTVGKTVGNTILINTPGMFEIRCLKVESIICVHNQFSFIK